MGKSGKSHPVSENAERTVRIICMICNEVIKMLLAWRGLRLPGCRLGQPRRRASCSGIANQALRHEALPCLRQYNQ